MCISHIYSYIYYIKVHNTHVRMCGVILGCNNVTQGLTAGGCRSASQAHLRLPSAPQQRRFEALVDAHVEVPGLMIAYMYVCRGVDLCVMNVPTYADMNARCILVPMYVPIECYVDVCMHAYSTPS